MQITSVSSITTLGGAVRICGEGFEAGDGATVGACAVTCTFVNDRMLEIEVPALAAAGEYAVCVIRHNGAFGEARLYVSEPEFERSKLPWYEGPIADMRISRHKPKSK